MRVLASAACRYDSARCSAWAERIGNARPAIGPYQLLGSLSGVQARAWHSLVVGTLRKELVASSVADIRASGMANVERARARSGGGERQERAREMYGERRERAREMCRES